MATSLYPAGPPPRRRTWRKVMAGFGLVVIGLAVLIGGYGTARVLDFLHSVANLNNPVDVIRNQVAPPPGSIAYKLQHGQQVNILALGYGGSENDAPYLTDTIMVVSIDPASKRVMEISLPRDTWVRINAYQSGVANQEKINAAFEIPNMPKAFGIGPLYPQYQGKDGPGHLAEDTVGRLTGIQFDRYVAVDFKAFRDAVDTLGGITVHMDAPLDDCHYPDYHDGYLNHGVPPGYPCPPGSGIHFPAGTYTVNGEQALEIARSRHASEPEQASDFARAKRQQMILAAIRQKAMSIDALPKVPTLMDQLQGEFQTDLTLNDITALYNFMRSVPNGSIGHFAITDSNLLVSFGPGSAGSCGPSDQYVLCSEDPTYQMWHAIFSRVFVPTQVLGERAPVELVNATYSLSDLQDRTADVLRQLGLQVAGTARGQHSDRTVIYDESGGKYPQTVAWLQGLFGAEVAPAGQGAGEPAAGAASGGLVVVMGSDFGRHWLGMG